MLSPKQCLLNVSLGEQLFIVCVEVWRWSKSFKHHFYQVHQKKPAVDKIAHLRSQHAAAKFWFCSLHFFAIRRTLILKHRVRNLATSMWSTSCCSFSCWSDKDGTPRVKWRVPPPQLEWKCWTDVVLSGPSVCFSVWWASVKSVGSP